MKFLLWVGRLKYSILVLMKWLCVVRCILVVRLIVVLLNRMFLSGSYLR